MAKEQKFTLSKGDHEVTTTIPAEAVELRARGYSDGPKAKKAPAAGADKTSN